MKIVKTNMQRTAWILLVGGLALLFVVGLSLVLTGIEVLAQPTAETASILLDKTANTDTAEPGDTVTYTIVIEGDGTTFYDSLWMTDTLPSELTYVPGSLQRSGPGSENYANGKITWSTSTFFGGDDRTVITYQAQISPDTTAFQVRNTAQLTGTGELTTDSWTVRLSTGLEPTSLIHSPINGDTITEKDTLTISGVAWDASIPRPFPGTPVLQPIDNFGGGGTYIVQWTEAVSATFYAVEEADNPQFDDATSPDPPDPDVTDTQYPIVGKAPGTYYYRVQAFNDEGRPSRWSNVESVVVQTTQATSSDAALNAPSDVSAPAEVAASGPVTVWVRIDSGAWQAADTTLNVDGWWDWTYDWALPEEDGVQHTIDTQAEDVVGSLSPIDTITVTVSNEMMLRYLPLVLKRWPPVPYPPILNNIVNPDQEPNYSVTWSYNSVSGVPDPTSYTLQESKDSQANFVDVYSGSGTSQSFTDKENGTYYYRVRGHNVWGPGEWSEVKPVTVNVFEYFDNFSNYQSGWPREWSKTRGALYRVRPYEHPSCPGSSCQYDEGDGYIIARRSGSDPTARFGPEVAVPSEDYEIELDARWWDAAYFATYQIFFGSDKDFEDYYALQVRINIVGDSRNCDYSVIRHTSSAVSASDVGSVAGDKVLQDWTRSSKIRCNLAKDNEGKSFDHWKIRREGDTITIWVNGDKLDDWDDGKFGANRYFGVGATLYEGFTPSKPEVDNWSVVLLDD